MGHKDKGKDCSNSKFSCLTVFCIICLDFKKFYFNDGKPT